MRRRPSHRAGSRCCPRRRRSKFRAVPEIRGTDVIHQRPETERGERLPSDGGEIAEARRQTEAEEAEDEGPGPQRCPRQDKSGLDDAVEVRRRMAVGHHSQTFSSHTTRTAPAMTQGWVTLREGPALKPVHTRKNSPVCTGHTDLTGLHSTCTYAGGNRKNAPVFALAMPFTSVCTAPAAMDETYVFSYCGGCKDRRCPGSIDHRHTGYKG